MFICFVVCKGFSCFTLCRLGGTFGRQSLSSFTNLTTMMYSHRIHLLLLAFRWTRIVAVAVCGLDASVHTMDYELGALISADLPSGVHSLFLGCEMTAGALRAATLNIPTSVGIVNDMMRRTCHINYPLCAFGQQVAQPSASK